MKISGAGFLLLAVWLSTAAVAGQSPYILVLGIAQDGGYPQAGCYQPHCLPAWSDPELKRFASSIAVVDPAAQAKLLFDATPDIREQLYSLHRDAPDPNYTLDAVFLTHAHMGHYTGLVHFGFEASSTRDVPVYAMPRMRAFLSENGPWDQLVRYRNIRLMALEQGKAVNPTDAISVTALRVPHRDEYSETVGFRIDGPLKSALFIPDIDKWERWGQDIVEQIRSVDYALLDATFFAEDELPGRSMADIPHPFVVESMRTFAVLSETERQRVFFIHFNHTNPLLRDASVEREQVLKRGFRIASEGLKLPL